MSKYDKALRNRGVVSDPASGDTDCTLCYSKGATKLSTFDWVSDLPKTPNDYDIVEIQFKNTRKGFYRNVNSNRLCKGDIVAVEATSGHDIGVVSLTGWLVLRQMKRQGFDPDKTELKKVYRRAKPADIEKWLEAVELEHATMIKSRQIAEELGLNMKIGDVEYQGDRSKAIFYYIADERVDFRELIKILAEEFKIRVEMRQIGARQEAGRIGGIGSCGRELCCSAWMSNFVSVSTNSAKVQEISLNPQKLAGQCGKLKCCLNYELECYIDARKGFPDANIPLETVEATYYHSKTDIFKRSMWYGTTPGMPVNLVEIPVERVKEIIALNKNGTKVDALLDERFSPAPQAKPIEFNSVLEGNLDRFDSKRKKRKTRQKAQNARAQSADNQQNRPQNIQNRPQNIQNRSQNVQNRSQNPQHRQPDKKARPDRPQGNYRQKQATGQATTAGTPYASRTYTVDPNTPNAKPGAYDNKPKPQADE